LSRTRPRDCANTSAVRPAIAATNRDLGAEMAAGRFRRDFYYRLCADVVITPTLAEQLAEAPDERASLVHAIAHRVAGDEEAARLAEETERWIADHLPQDYPWPGNVRELEQCVRNVMIRGEYRPALPAHGDEGTDDAAALARSLRAGDLTMDEVVRRYCTLVYERTGSFVETARRLGIDRRPVGAKVDAGARGVRAPERDR
jgi:DNA-binding NtrC family response regulator